MPKPNSSTLTYEQLSELLSYDPLTGDLYWKVPAFGRRMGVPAGSPTKGGYTSICVARARHQAHRLAWLLSYGTWPVDMLDHINGVRDDNRLANLREATREINAQNQHRKNVNATGYAGVQRQHRGRSFVARIRVGGKNKHLGCFPTAEEAHLVNVAAKRLWHPGNML